LQLSAPNREDAMTLPRREFLRLAAGAAALPALSRIARAQAYPTRPVRWIVPFPAGGQGDILTRLIGQWLSERLGQPFVIENRTGAAGNIGTEAVVRSAPDGHTLLFVSTPTSINATLYDNLNFNFIRDIAPVASMSRGVGVMVVTPAFPSGSVAEFIAYAKANPGQIRMASGGYGSLAHVYGELFKMMAGIDLAHVPYRGTPLALPDLLSGQVQVMFDLATNALEQIRTGKLRALGVTTATRLDVLPDIPAIAESLPGYEASGWQGVGAPKNTPTEIVDRLHKEINAALADPKIAARLADLGLVAMPMSLAEFGKFIADETEKWGKVVKFAGLKPQ
jgi:tripartite-type tricarboxylate transporter receptor subunit TctC